MGGYETEGHVVIQIQSTVNESSIAQNAIEFFRHYKTGQYPMVLKNKPKNLFNKSTVTTGYYCKYQDGTLVANASYSASDYIPVYPGQVLIKNNLDQLAFYNENKVFISGMGTFSSSTSFTVPAGAYYIKISGSNSGLSSLQLEEGTVTTTYENHYTNLLYDLSKYFTLSSVLSMLGDNVVKPGLNSANLFDKSTATTGYYCNYLNGTLVANASYGASDYISVNPTKAYIKSNGEQFAFFDANKTFISGLGSGTTSFTAPAGAYFVRLSYVLSGVNTFQMVEGSTLPDYLPYGLKYITDNQLAPDIRAVKAVEDIISKVVLSSKTVKIKLIGDSITHGVAGTGFAQDGATIMTLSSTTWNINTSGHCWANSLKSYLEAKFNCQVLNYGCTGTNSNHIVNGLSQLIDGTEDIVICMIGTNDRSNSTKQGFYNNLVTIYNYCNELGIDFIFMSNIPASVTQEQGETNHMEDIDHIMMKASLDLKLEYISVYKLFIEYCQSRGITIDSLLADGLHPNDAGYDVMFYLICNALGFGTKRPDATW